MNKEKQKVVKSARKTLRKGISISLTDKLKEIAASFGQGSAKLDKAIEKDSKKLAKKFLKEIKVDVATFLKNSADQETTQTAPLADNTKLSVQAPKTSRNGTSKPASKSKKVKEKVL